ncbi:PIG-L family deacetylase [Micromonospora sp. NPDC094482]|uniref:PIG-L family deacetylase n=1 Tax=unclassified Micromonospora TaxID=2617518 RepID=UPI00332494E4
MASLANIDLAWEFVVTIVSRRQVLGATAGIAATGLLGAPAQAADASPALFAVAHPDDEILGIGVALAEHLALGQDVHVLWLSRGTRSNARALINGATTSPWWGVPHVPTAEGYTALSVDEFGAARIAEGMVAVNSLAAGTSGTLTLHEARLEDGAINQADVQRALLSVADRIAPGRPVRIKTHSHVIDDHPDHIASALAARALAASYPARFSDLRHYILPAYWSDPRLDQVAETWDAAANAEITQRVRNAIRAYGAWSPARGSFAIGWHSVPTYFAALEANPRSLMHH